MPTITPNRPPNIEAITAFNGKALITTQDYQDLKAYEHALAFTVAKIADQDMLAEVHKAMKQAIEHGMTFADFQKRLKPYLMAKGWLGLSNNQEGKVVLGHRLKTIYHTNKQTAYAAGQWTRIQKTKAFLPYLQYMPSLSERQRDEHRRYYGLIRPVDDPIWQFIMPPNGFGCKCWVKQLTKQQAQAVGITPNDDDKANIEWTDYKNPKTGQVVQVPKGIAPSFNHNHDRLTAMLRLAEEKHGGVFTQALQVQLTDFMLDMAKGSGVAVADFTGVKVMQSEVERLLVDKLDNKPKLHEAMAGAEYQVYYGVRLERPEPVFDNGNPQAGFDYWVTDDGKRLDFMYTMHGYANKKVEMLNKFFAHTDQEWQNKQQQIKDHLDKADIVPIDLRYLSVENRVKLVSFVLSLSKEQQSQIIFITGQV